jgi:hypothetical protein
MDELGGFTIAAQRYYQLPRTACGRGEATSQRVEAVNEGEDDTSTMKEEDDASEKSSFEKDGAKHDPR